MAKVYKVTFGIDFGDSYSSVSFRRTASNDPDQAHGELVEFVYAHLTIDTEVVELSEAIENEKSNQKGGE